MGGDGWDSDQTVKIGGKAVEGCYFSNHYSADEDRPEVKTFVETLQARKYQRLKVPDAMAILGYDSMKLMADAIKRAGSDRRPQDPRRAGRDQGLPRRQRERSRSTRTATPRSRSSS